MSYIKDGGPAFPINPETNMSHKGEIYRECMGLTMRDWFAGHCQEDDRLVKCIRAMDDAALEIFALHPNLERDENLTEVEFTCWGALPTEVAKIARRLELEAKAIARVRFMQADAMLAVREESK